MSRLRNWAIVLGVVAVIVGIIYLKFALGGKAEEPKAEAQPA